MNEQPARDRALVVEDDDAVRRLVTTILRREGFEVVAVDDGGAALALLSGGDSYTVVVLDLVLRGASGMEVLLHLRTHHPAMLRHVVVITGALHVRLDHVRDGLCTVLGKPFDLEAFIRAVRACARVDG